VINVLHPPLIPIEAEEYGCLNLIARLTSLAGRVRTLPKPARTELEAILSTVESRPWAHDPGQWRDSLDVDSADLDAPLLELLRNLHRVLFVAGAATDAGRGQIVAALLSSTDTLAGCQPELILGEDL
jgi:hypothetical protein